MSSSPDFIYKQIMDYVSTQGGFDDPYDLMDNLTRQMGAGSEYGKFNDTFRGLNRLPNMLPLAAHKELQGLCLFTRPNLNLSYDNISLNRVLMNLLTNDTLSYQYAIRFLLDPTTYRLERVSPLVDPNWPYINILSNTIQTLSPPPDIGIQVYRSPEGIMKETWLMNDSQAEYNGAFTMTATFQNFSGNGIIALFHSWIMYMGMIRTGPSVPHPKQRAHNEMDYNTRIERYKFNEAGTHLTQWFHTGAALPTNVSIGAGQGFNRESAYDTENNQVSVTFECVGAVYNDPIQLFEFNARIAMWNKNMADDKRSNYFTKIPRGWAAETNMHGYPRINLETGEMEWWLENDKYQQLTKRYR